MTLIVGPDSPLHLFCIGGKVDDERYPATPSPDIRDLSLPAHGGVSTFGTDHLLVNAARFDAAIAALRAAGHVVGYNGSNRGI